MSDSSCLCAECGGPLPACWPKSFCPRCALDGLLDSSEAAAQVGGVGELKSSSNSRPPTASPAPGITGVRFGDYELLEEIARGGMGVVFRAHQASLNRTVALKMILSGEFASKQEVSRFRAEAEAAANLRHANIVAIHETGEEGGRHYFSMDYVRGRNLAEIALDGPLSARRAARYGKVVAEAIQYAHEQGVLHRDLKPSNILIDENDHPRITDFGLAKRARTDFGLTLTGQTLGSPGFMPPEQTLSKSGKIGPASDVYGLGAILYHLLTGRPPFQAETIEEVLRQLHEADPVAPRLLNPSVPRDLETICLKCLEKDPARRYASAQELAGELDRFLRDEPIQARPLRSPEKIWRWCRRKPMVASLIALLLVVGGAGFAGILWKNEALERNLYFNRVALAHRESTAEPSNVKDAEKLLDGCLPRFRNWEWSYLKRRRYAEPLVLSDPEGQGVHSVSFSLDGRYLASGGDGGKIRIWDLVEPKGVQILSAHTGFVASVAFSPQNPTWVASAGSDQQLVLSDWRTGEKLYSWPCKADLANGMAYAIAFSPDGQLLAAPAEHGEVIIREITTGAVVHRLQGHEEVAQCVSFSPDGRWVATGSSRGIVSLWNASTGKRVKSIGPPSPPVSGVAFSRDGRRLVATHVGGFVEVWDTESQREISFFRAGNPVLTGLAFHPNSKRLFTGGSDRLVTVWEPETQRQVVVFRELNRGCSCLALSRDGHRLAAGSSDGTVHVWDATPLEGTEFHNLRTLEYPGEVWALDVAPNGLSIAVAGLQPFDLSAGRGAEVRLWHSPDFPEPVRLPGHSIVVFSVAYDSTGRFLASSGDEELQPGRARVKVWDLEAGRAAFPVEAFEGDQVLFSVCFSRDGRWLVGGGRDRKIKVWNAHTGQKVSVLGEHTDDIIKLTFSRNGTYLASSGNDGAVKLWDATSLDRAQKPLRQFEGQFEDFADLIAFSHDGSRLAVVSGDDRVMIHDIAGGHGDVQLISRGHRPLALAFSPDGRWVASGGKDCAVKVWDARTAKLLQTFKSHADHVTRLLFFQRPEGLCLASGSRDSTVKLWDVAPTQ